MVETYFFMILLFGRSTKL